MRYSWFDSTTDYHSYFNQKVYIYNNMNTTMQHIIVSQQQETCWYEDMRCSLDTDVG
jgi:hypothetical protein